MFKHKTKGYYFQWLFDMADGRVCVSFFKRDRHGTMTPMNERVPVRPQYILDNYVLPSC